MKTASFMFLISLAFGGGAAADLPVKAPITKYSGLWNNSPFTSKPPPPVGAPEVNPLDDYALGGISPISGGYRVTLLNKKNPEERITVDSDSTKSGFKILAVTRKDGDPLGTVVRMSSGTLTGTVAFDDKLLALAPPPAPKPAPRIPGQPVIPGQPPIPGQLQPGQMPVRQPRPRVVPPPAPQGQVQGQAQPQIQPQIPGQVQGKAQPPVPTTPQQGGFDRSDRRRR